MNQIENYLVKLDLPNISLNMGGEFSTLFLRLGIQNLWEAVSHLNHLPYGRLSKGQDFKQVLLENKGTCSSKHALLAALAEELNVPLQL